MKDKQLIINIKLFKKMHNKINFTKKLLEKALENPKEGSFQQRTAWKLELKNLTKLVNEIEETDFKTL